MIDTRVSGLVDSYTASKEELKFAFDSLTEAEQVFFC
jgi:hypothetical protein